MILIHFFHIPVKVSAQCTILTFQLADVVDNASVSVKLKASVSVELKAKQGVGQICKFKDIKSKHLPFNKHHPVNHLQQYTGKIWQ